MRQHACSLQSAQAHGATTGCRQLSMAQHLQERARTESANTLATLQGDMKRLQHTLQEERKRAVSAPPRLPDRSS